MAKTDGGSFVFFRTCCDHIVLPAVQKRSFLSLLPLRFLRRNPAATVGRRKKKKKKALSPSPQQETPAPAEGLTDGSIVVARSAEDALFGFPHHTVPLLINSFIYLNIPLSPRFIPVVAAVAVVPGVFFWVGVHFIPSLSKTKQSLELETVLTSSSRKGGNIALMHQHDSYQTCQSSAERRL